VAAAGVDRERNQRLIVVNSSGDALADPGFAQPADLDWTSATLEEAGVEFTIRQSVRGRERGLSATPIRSLSRARSRCWRIHADREGRTDTHAGNPLRHRFVRRPDQRQPDGCVSDQPAADLVAARAGLLLQAVVT